MKPTLVLKMGQQLTMTPQLQQTIHLLQLSSLDLQQEVQEALEANPMLEMADDGDDDYSHDGADSNGRVSIDWGVYGVPETFIVDRGGIIVFKHVGPLSPAAISEDLLPALTAARAD